MNKLIIIIFLVLPIFLFYNCKEHKAGDGHNHGLEAEQSEEAHDEHENVNTTMLTKEQMKSIKIELGNIEKKQLTSSLKANGLLKVPNQNRANVTAFLGGVIKSILVQSGNTVTRGQTIATISNHTFITMQEEYLTILSKINLAQLEFNRQNELQQGNAGALKNLQMTESELNILKSRKASLNKQLELIGINPLTLNNENIQSTVKINSPISGVISNVMVNIGSYVDASNTIAEIVDNSQLHVDLYVYEKDLAKLKEGQNIHFTLTNNPGKEYDADVYAISNTFEQNTKAIAIHAKVKGNKQGLIDGMSITALVSLEHATSDAVPTNAIVSHEGQDYIFIVSDVQTEEAALDSGTNEPASQKYDDHEHLANEKEKMDHKEKGTTFEKIPIRKGTTDVGYSEITLLKDIPVNSKIVTNGAFFILAKMNNKGEGHQH